MTGNSAIRCATPRCIKDIADWGEHYHDVHDSNHEKSLYPTATANCNRCGGHTDGTTWWHKCKMCGKDVEPGTLKGFFVPHRCKECDEKVIANDKATGNICTLCHTVRSYCCC